MELFVFILIAAVGAAWYWNHTVQKKLRQEQQAKSDAQAPYKIEPTPEPAVTPAIESVEQSQPEPAKPVKKASATKKSAVVKTTGQAKNKRTTKTR